MPKKKSISVEHRSSASAIFAAAAAGSFADVSGQLKLGVEPSKRDHNLYTALHYTARSGDLPTINLLLQFQDTGWAAHDVLTPVHLAAKCGRPEAVKRLVTLEGYQWNREQAIDAIAAARIKAAMQHRFDAALEQFFDRKTYSAKELAIMYGHADTAVAFHSYVNNDLPWAFSCACMMGRVHIVERLWKHNEARGYRSWAASLQRSWSR